MIVMKFGGTSVGSAERMDHVAGLVSAEARPSVVVVSAMSGTTDQLLEAGRLASAGQRERALGRVAEIRARHLGVAGDDSAVRAELETVFQELDSLVMGIHLLGEQTARSRAALAALGERLSAPLVAKALRAAGRAAEAVDARRLFVTDSNYESATVDQAGSEAQTRARLLPLLEAGTVPVVTGFLGATAEGVTTVLGRGGSDWTASLLGALLRAEEVWIWTDVDGVLTADPRIVRDARPLERVSWLEASEMSYFGAKVVHPKTMAPAKALGIPLRIRSTFHPERPGTLISDDTVPAPFGVKTVTSVRDAALLVVEGPALAGSPEVIERLFATTAKAEARLLMVSQASSEQSVTLVVPAEDLKRLRRAIERTFKLELKVGLVLPVRTVDDVAVVTAIGDAMAGQVGTSARLFTALARSGVNVVAIAQGAGERSISAAVAGADMERAVRSVHSSFGLTHAVDLVVLGAGQVARRFLEMLDQSRDRFARELGLELRVLAISTSKVWIEDAGGLEVTGLADRVRSEGTPRPSDEDLCAWIEGVRAGPAVMVDLSAAPLGALHADALEKGIHVVTANKKPLSGSTASYATLMAGAQQSGVRYGYETTFGAGLPVLHTLRELIDTGDQIVEVSGCLSGTLGFLCTELDAGVPLVDAVERARVAGYTEPDPRDDLSGADVGRKAVIIARAMGLALEPSEVRLDPFVDGLDAGLEPALAVAGPALEARRVAARERGEVLRYVAVIRAEGVEVGLREVPADGPIGSLSGPDNLLVFRTARYRDYPLVVRGPGAGAEVTAAGVLGDVLRIARGR